MDLERITRLALQPQLEAEALKHQELLKNASKDLELKIKELYGIEVDLKGENVFPNPSESQFILFVDPDAYVNEKYKIKNINLPEGYLYSCRYFHTLENILVFITRSKEKEELYNRRKQDFWHRYGFIRDNDGQPQKGICAINSK